MRAHGDVIKENDNIPIYTYRNQYTSIFNISLNINVQYPSFQQHTTPLFILDAFLPGKATNKSVFLTVTKEHSEIFLGTCAEFVCQPPEH